MKENYTPVLRPDDSITPPSRDYQVDHSIPGHPPGLRLNRHAVTISNFQTVSGFSLLAVVSIDTYSRGGIALRVIDENGPLMTLTAWTEGIPPGHVAIRNYPEARGCLDQLIRHRVVEPTGKLLDGFPICRLGTAFRG